MTRSLVHGPKPLLQGWAQTTSLAVQPAVPDPDPWAFFVEADADFDVPDGLEQTPLPPRPPVGLLVTDMDSTLIEEEVIDELARRAGRYEEVAQVTEAAMRGELDFEGSLRRRVAALAGAPASILEQVRGSVHVRPGASRMVRAVHGMGGQAGVVSGGFLEIVRPVADALGLDLAHAHRLRVRAGRLTGEVDGPIVGGPEKAATLRRWAAERDVPREAILALGDGANDLEMLGEAGLGVAFCAKPKVQASAEARLNEPRLDGVLHLWGLDEAAIDAAVAKA